MQPPPAFQFPPRATQVPYNLSPPRVNNARLASTSTSTSKTTEPESVYPSSSIHSSPTKQRANLFADYHLVPTSPSKVSAFALPQSPSLPEIHALRANGHVRTNSDVQGLVKRFEHLDVRDKDAESAERRKKHEAELRRAQIAREEAESDVKRLREEIRRMKEDYAEVRERERRVDRRLEVVMGEYAQVKETHSSQASIYEKELRKARKEAFKSSSHLVKLQEELKSARQSLRIAQAGFDLERQKVQRREQETFDAQYQLVAAQEEIGKLKEVLKVVEEERNVLKTSLKKEELASIAAEGRIALPAASHEEGDLCGSQSKRSPRKECQPSPLSDDKENLAVVTKKQLDSRRLQEELCRERMARAHADAMLEFLRLECDFRCCSCRIASRLDHAQGLAMPDEVAESLAVVRRGMKGKVTLSGEPHDAEIVRAQVGPGVRTESSIRQETTVIGGEASSSSAEAPVLMDEDDRSMTMLPEDAVGVLPQTRMEDEAPKAPHPSPADTSDDADAAAASDSRGEAIQAAVSNHPPRPTTPPQPKTTAPSHHRPNLRTVTTTTTVPMHFTPVSKPLALLSDIAENAENIPPSPSTATTALEQTHATATFDRAAALAAIEYRRGRAKSFAQGQLTPRKQMVELKERRDISAPALGQKAGGGTGGVGKGGGSVGRAGGRRMV